MTEHEQNLRDLAAMFAMAVLLAKGESGGLTQRAFSLANEFIQERKTQDAVPPV